MCAKPPVHRLLACVVLLASGCTTPVYVNLTFDELAEGTELTDASSIKTSILDASLTNTSPRSAEIKSSPIGSCGGIYLNDNTLTLDPMFDVDLASFRFAEYGGQNQLTVNGNVLDARDLIDLNGVSGTGYAITVEAELQGANWFGAIAVVGTIDSIALRGQELLIDDVVFRTDSGQVPNKVLLDVRVYTPSGGSPTGYDGFRDLLRSKGYDVDVHTSGDLGPGALDGYDVYIGRLYNHNFADPTFGYEAGEPNRLASFVRQGGSAFLITELGPSFIHPVYTFFLNPYGIQHENNLVIDPTHSNLEDFWVFYERDRNFECHPIVRFVQKVQFRAGATLVGSSAQIVIHTGPDATPQDRPVLLAQRVDLGRLVVVGDSTTWREIAEWDNEALAQAIVDWLALRL